MIAYISIKEFFSDTISSKSVTLQDCTNIPILRPVIGHSDKRTNLVWLLKIASKSIIV